MGEFNDAHISYSIPSTLASSLPFDTEYFRDGVIIKNINRESLPESIFPFHDGDQLIAMDGIAINSVIESLIPYKRIGNEASNKKEVATFLTSRTQNMFIDIPSGNVILSILKRGESTPINVTTQWVQTGFDVAEIPPKGAISTMFKTMRTPPENRTARSFLEEIADDREIDMGSSNGRQKQPFFPLWDGFQARTLDPFLTGIFEINGHKIGFIRIDTWSDNKLPDRDAIISFFKNEIAFLTNNTDAMVIDQTNNGGGHVCHVYRVASFFTEIERNESRFQLYVQIDHG